MTQNLCNLKIFLCYVDSKTMAGCESNPRCVHHKARLVWNMLKLICKWFQLLDRPHDQTQGSNCCLLLWLVRVNLTYGPMGPCSDVCTVHINPLKPKVHLSNIYIYISKFSSYLKHTALQNYNLLGCYVMWFGRSCSTIRHHIPEDRSLHRHCREKS
jgi:hypothetical protein